MEMIAVTVGLIRRSTMACAVMAMSSCIAWAGIMNPIAGDPVVTDGGKVAGTLLDSGVQAYFGIPYAAPPVNELRWHAPVPAKPWKGVYNADTPRPACVQRIFSAEAINAPPEVAVISEDCLYLNIWTPSTAKIRARLPVLVYIHGGAFQFGSPNYAKLDGSSIASKGIIFVGVAYRLGVLGFMAHPELTKESGHHASGNWGILDQIAALQWV